MPIIVPPDQLGALRAGEAAMQGQLAAAQLRQRGAEALGQGFAGFGQGIGQGLSAAALREQQERQHKEEMEQRQKFWQDGLVAKGVAEYVYSPQNQKKVETLKNNLDLALQDDTMYPEQKQFVQELYDRKMQEIGPPNIFRMKEKPRLIDGLADGESREWRDPDTGEYLGKVIRQGDKVDTIPVRKSAAEHAGKVTPQMLSDAGQEAANELMQMKFPTNDKWTILDATPEDRQWLRNRTMQIARDKRMMLNEVNYGLGQSSETQPKEAAPSVAKPEAAPVIMQKTLKNGTPVQVMVLPDGRYKVIGSITPTAPAAPAAPTAPQQTNYQSTHRER